jgi:hypothetical protein
VKLSIFFEENQTAYLAELEDLQCDSEGNDTLTYRLNLKRKEIKSLLPMLEMAPEMVAVIFYEAFKFDKINALQELVALEPEEFPTWGEVVKNMTIAPWAQNLLDTILTQEGGERFLLTTCGLEYLRTCASVLSEAKPAKSNNKYDDEDNENEEDELDLEERGNAWLTEQGFDSKS